MEKSKLFNKIKEISKKYYPGFNISDIIKFNNAYYVNLIPLNHEQNNSFLLMEWHKIDESLNDISGNIPTMVLFENKGFLKAYNEAKSVKKENYLIHHGIKGQRWGIRRFQNKDGSLTSAGKERYYGITDKLTYSGAVAVNAKSFAKGVAIGVLRSIPGIGTVVSLADLAKTGVAAAKMASDSYSKSHNSEDDQNKKVMLKYADLDTKISSEKDVLKIQGSHSAESDLKAVNPANKNIFSNTGSQNNCMFCTTTYDLRRRGYDVTAKMGYGRNTYSIKDWYKNAKVEPSGSKTWKELTNKLSEFPDGARGNIMVRAVRDYTAVNFSPVQGHSMVWEKQNGKVVIRDAQCGKTYNASTFGLTSSWDAKTATYVRTDNLEVNWPAINEVCANYKRK